MGITRSISSGSPFLIVNAGSAEWNYTVKSLADQVSLAFGGIEVSINREAPPDRRSYQVSFEKFRSLAPNHQPLVSLTQAVDDLKMGLEGMGFSNSDFRKSQFIRLNVLKSHVDQRLLNTDLYWTTP